ncbi:MAG: winged helix-turn-helix transcriptional regulator, partial [Acholeplasmatales bacterium]|nr:winged helix-turn-helix transcriptional regulator [Acholeplasmatales bacterium]
TSRDISKKIYDKIKPIPNTTINVIPFDDKKSYIIVVFNGFELPYSVNGRYYYRVTDESREMTPFQLKEFFFNTSDVSKEWELKPTNFTVNDVDTNVLEKNYNDGFEMGRISDVYVNPEISLSKLGLLNELFLNNAGNLLFSNKEPIWLKMGVFATEQKITILDMNQVHSNIFSCIAESMKFISKNIRWEAQIGDVKRVDVPEIPINAIREIVVNCFTHSNYKNTDTAHEIDIYPNKITFYNPGGLPQNIEPYSFVKENKSSSFRNPKIADILFRCGQIEAFGTGFKRAFSLLDDENIKYEYINNNQGFTFVIYRKPLYSNENRNYNIGESETYVLELLKKNPTIKNEEIASLIFKSEKTVYRYIIRLMELNYIRRVGTKKNGYWEILK